MATAEDDLTRVDDLHAALGDALEQVKGQVNPTPLVEPYIVREDGSVDRRDGVQLVPPRRPFLAEEKEGKHDTTGKREASKP